MAKSFSLRAVISAVDKVSGPLKRINQSLGANRKAFADVASATANAAGKVAAPLMVAGGVAAGAFGLGLTGLVSTNAQFEKFQTILETVEGSAEKAKASMGWVSDFAAKTPYELAEVTDSFVKLKAYGIDPQSGALKAAGDAAAAMGKPLEQAVEALADAMTGENERLKEFGITADTTGNQIVYKWVENGKTMAAVANKTSKAQIQAVVTGIWNRRYQGAMDKLSKTMEGMWSNIKDTASRFLVAVGDAGFFDALKGEMQGVLDLLNQWSEDGSIKAVAEEISGALVGAIKGLRENLQAVNWKEVVADVKAFWGGVQTAVTAVGGWGNALLVLAVILNAQTIVAVMEMIGAVARLGFTLGATAVRAVMAAVPMFMSFAAAMAPVIAATWAWTVALLANPLTWIVLGVVAAIAAVIALAAGVAWAVTHWEQFKAAVAGAADALVGAFGKAVDWVGEKLNGLLDGALKVWNDIKGIFSGDGQTELKAPNISFGIIEADKAKKAAQVAAAPAAAGAAAAAPPPVAANTNAANSNTPQPVNQTIGAAAAGSAVPLKGEMVVRFENTPPGTRIDAGATNQPGLTRNMPLLLTGWRSEPVLPARSASARTEWHRHVRRATPHCNPAVSSSSAHLPRGI